MVELVDPTTPKAGPFTRIAAFVAGAVVLLCGVVVSLGGVLLALFGMVIVSSVQRRRGRPFTRGEQWIAACSSMAIVLAIGGGALLSVTPRSTFDSMKHAADSSSALAAKQQPPAWLERIAPGYRAQRAAVAPNSRALTVLSAIFGIGFALTFFATLYGSLAWSAGMLLGLGMRGRWPGAREDDGASPPT